MSKKKSNKVLYFIDFGIFPGCVMFSCGFSYWELIKILGKKGAWGWRRSIEGEEKDFEDCHWRAGRRVVENLKTGEKKTYFYIFIRNRFEFTDEHYRNLAHEILHICQFYLPDILDRNNEHEAEAYFHSYLMDRCLEATRGKEC